MTLVRVCVLLSGVFALAGAAQNDTMAPLSQYLMSPQAEIALARSAAPAAISKSATIMVLGAHGYAVAQRACVHLQTNGNGPGGSEQIADPGPRRSSDRRQRATDAGGRLDGVHDVEVAVFER
jgi:hypothetical protein